MTGENAQNTTAAAPIADLSYRGYDGPLHSRSARWWIVALAGIRMMVRKVGFWITAALALFPYLIVGITLFIRSMTGAGGMGDMGPFGSADPQHPFGALFFDALSNQQLMLAVMAMVVGSGSIAADNRANALQVYLSKPITKLDYLVGKWMGVFLDLYLVALVPALALYGYCLLSFLKSGFLAQEPWLIAQIVLAAMVPAAVHASLICACSAWSKTPRMAAAVYAGLYFVGGIVTTIVWAVQHHGHPGHGILLRHLSINGAITGLAQNIYGVTPHIPTFNRHTMMMERTPISPPSLGWMLLLAAALVAVGILATRARIRAVEVVRG